MCGSATLAIEESSTTMNVASITDSATIQGFTVGFTAGFAAGFTVARSSPDAAPIGINGLLAVLNRQVYCNH